jgi:hypothetical protein
MRKYFLLLTILFTGLAAFPQSSFFTQTWVEYEGRINNNRETGERTRVNDRGMSTHPSYSKRYETQVNGLALINIRDTILQLEKAELFSELWGGHPKTANKRFQVNGGNYISFLRKKPRPETVSIFSHWFRSITVNS